MPRISALVAALILVVLPAPAWGQVTLVAPTEAESGQNESADDGQAKQAAEEEAAAAARAQQVADATSRIQSDLNSLQSVREAAQSRFDVAESESQAVATELARNEKKVAAARRLISIYMRSIYMNGPTELTMLATIVDSEDPGDLLKRTDTALRVGDHKDDQFRDAVDLLRRTEEAKRAADAALAAARQSLGTVDEQVAGLRSQLADVATEWASSLQAGGGWIDAEQIRRNGEAATAWAEYLSKLADWRVPQLTAKELRRGDLPTGVSTIRGQPGLAVYRHRGRQGGTIRVLPEETISAVTYAISRLGVRYRWGANSPREMDCSALVDRSRKVPGLPAAQRSEERPRVQGGIRGLARGMRLLPAAKRALGDVVFVSHDRAGVNHAGFAVTDDLMVAADALTGAVNAVPLRKGTAWRMGRLSLKAPGRANVVPGPAGKTYQCGADPDALITLPDGRTLSAPQQCPSSSGVFGEAHMQRAALFVGRCTALIWPQLTTIYGWVAVPLGPAPDHVSGRAVDVMMPGGCSTDPGNVGLGNQIAEFYMRNADKFGVEYLMWQHRIWNATFEEPKPIAQWRWVSERGDCTSNHMDHVHITMKGPNVAPGIGKQFNPGDWQAPSDGEAPAEQGRHGKPAKPGKPGKSPKPDAGSGGKAPGDGGESAPPGGGGSKPDAGQD